MNLRLPPPFWRRLAGSSVIDAERFRILCGSRAAPYWPRAPRNAPVPPTIAKFPPLWAKGAPGGGGPPFGPKATMVPIGVPSGLRISNVWYRSDARWVSAIASPGLAVGLSLIDQA